MDEVIHTKIRKIEAGYVIGEKNFLLNQAMPYKAKCISFASIIYLDYIEFLEVLK
jgi:hypothetical protein